MLKIEDLSVEIAGKRILKKIDLVVTKGEVHVFLGPNGSGKTSLMQTILGLSNCKVVSGKIWFDDIDITDMPINERVKLGIGIAFQNPPAIRGVKLGHVVRSFLEGKDRAARKEIRLARAMNFPFEFLDRDLNLGFSGGEIKRSEILQVLAQRPKFAILDEPDSGVDVENLEVIGKAINNFLEGRSGLIVTHLGHILNYVKTDVAHVLIGGRVACSGKSTKVLSQILKEGYKWCERCLREKGVKECKEKKRKR
jgi:Fe-S cluster assembly ATP-binding protein